ncbi:MFS transporter [Clostridium ljungdahlii]|uniref:Putative transport protein HsrA n=1 Tax=Clostridium ljungdahlii TaxID=1538 RepID=A0A162NCX8_9CLOT|nr:MFS transporter [Clostridium ljungdahlii]OAA91949.1 putative transport protein HsrA [Clostridium ljungdahlii]
MNSVKSKTGISTVIIIMLGTFISSFDINVVNTALPIMQSYFHASMSSIEWIIVGYLMVLGATQLTFGRLSDMFGHKKIYVAGLILFTISSFFCALSTSIVMLIVFRITQAIGASMISSSGSPIIIDAVDTKNRGKSLGMIAISVAVAVCTGPALGGLLASRAGWSSIFFINVPIGIAVSILAIKVIKKDDKRRNEVQFDFAGSTLIIAAIFLILLPLNLLSKSYFNIGSIVSFLGGIFVLLLFIVFEKKSKHPILNMELFKNRVFTGSTFAAMFFYMGEFILVFLAPYYLQKMRMLTPFMSGVMMLPMSIAMIIAAPLSGTISDNFDSRYIGCAGLAVMALATLFVGGFNASTPIWMLTVVFFIYGLGGGFFQTPNTSAVMGSVTADRRGVASAALGTMRTFGMMSGEAISAALIAFSMNKSESTFISKGLKSTLLWQAEFSFSTKVTCIVAAICVITAIVLSFVRGKSAASCGNAAVKTN